MLKLNAVNRPASRNSIKSTGGIKSINCSKGGGAYLTGALSSKRKSINWDSKNEKASTDICSKNEKASTGIVKAKKHQM